MRQRSFPGLAVLRLFLGRCRKFHALSDDSLVHNKCQASPVFFFSPAGELPLSDGLAVGSRVHGLVAREQEPANLGSPQVGPASFRDWDDHFKGLLCITSNFFDHCFFGGKGASHFRILPLFPFCGFFKYGVNA